MEEETLTNNPTSVNKIEQIWQYLVSEKMGTELVINTASVRSLSHDINCAEAYVYQCLASFQRRGLIKKEKNKSGGIRIYFIDKENQTGCDEKEKISHPKTKSLRKKKPVADVNANDMTLSSVVNKLKDEITKLKSCINEKEKQLELLQKIMKEASDA